MTPENLLNLRRSRAVISVVVPARNEERNLERCLRSIVTQRGVPFELIVVDDASTDNTRDIAESFTEVRDCPFIGNNPDLVQVLVISARSPLPAGWTGKSNACHTGALRATGEWILFTDADTNHHEGSLAKAYAEAVEYNADLLSYSPEQTVRGLAQKAVMPVVFVELASKYAPVNVNDPASPIAAANGQYLLIRRATYDSIGGFEAVRGTLLEDVAIAQKVKSSGGRLRFRLGRGLVSTEMYRTWSEMRDGWTKNLALLFPKAQKLAAARIIESLWMSLLPLAAIVCAALRLHTAAIVLAIFAAPV